MHTRNKDTINIENREKKVNTKNMSDDSAHV